MAPNSSILAWKIPWRRSLVGCSPWGRWGSDMTERLHFHFSLSCIGEGNGNPLQCSCLENPRDGGTRWAAIYGVAQRQIQLKRLSSSSSSSSNSCNSYMLNAVGWCLETILGRESGIWNYRSSLLHDFEQSFDPSELPILPCVPQ